MKFPTINNLMQSERSHTDLPFAAIEEALANGLFKEVFSELHRLREIVAHSSSRKDKAIFCHLCAEAFYKIGDYRRAIIKGKTALRLMTKVNNDTLFAAMKVTVGNILVRIGRLRDAADCFNESYVFFKRSHDYRSMISPLNALAHVHYIQGNLSQASEVMENLVESLICQGDRKNASAVKRNLAMVQITIGNLDRAMQLIESVRFDCRTDFDVAYLSQFRGIVRAFYLDYDNASFQLSEAYEYFKKSGLTRESSVCLEYLGLVSTLTGNYSKAREYYQQVLDMPEPTASAVAQTLRMLTDVYVAEGDFKLAKKTAEEAEAAIGKVNERRELAALYRAYGQIHDHEGAVSESKEYFTRSIDILSEIGAKYELALSYMASGRCASFTEEERMGRLHIARTLFAGMNVPKRVAQVDEAMSELRRQSVPNIVRYSVKTEKPVIIAASRKMKELLECANEIAPSNANVLLTGETGTGKDMLAHYIHYHSGRSGALVNVNATAFPGDMIESELFGYRRGAFTGARREKRGLIEECEQGTLFLNEIGDATPEFQAKLLEAIETRQIRRLGENGKREVDFRLISATNSDLGSLLREGRFRIDLFHRLKEVSIHVPPLRTRPEDIAELVRFFLSSDDLHNVGSGFDGNTIDRLSEVMLMAGLSGNVRELKARILELSISCRADGSGMVQKALSQIAADEAGLMRKVLEHCRWNRCRAAWLLGISEGAVRKRIRKWNIVAG